MGQAQVGSLSAVPVSPSPPQVTGEDVSSTFLAKEGEKLGNGTAGP